MNKRGFYLRLAGRSLRLNGKFYLPYLLSGMVTAAMFYDILFLNMNRGIYRMQGVNAVRGLLGFGAIVVAVFSFALVVAAVTAFFGGTFLGFLILLGLLLAFLVSLFVYLVKYLFILALNSFETEFTVFTVGACGRIFIGCGHKRDKL